jgi:ribosomal protein S18 acetylase RimI-like enzyme
MRLFRISLATGEDLDDIIRLRTEATNWLGSLKLDQWQQSWPSAEDERERFVKSVEKGQTWIVRNGSYPVATFAIDTFSDPHLWINAEQSERALYIHRFIVRREYSGIGLGAKLMDLIESWAAHDDFQWLRVDVWTTNTRLQVYYRRIGFDHVRTIESDYPSGALFQREVPKRTHL